MTRSDGRALLLLGPGVVGWLLLARSGNVHLLTDTLASGYAGLIKPWKPFVAIITALLVWEKLRPVEVRSPVNASAGEDLWWFVSAPLFNAALSFAAMLAVDTIYTRLLGGHVVIPGMVGWPWILRAIIGFVLSDMLFYWSHVARHRIPLLWRFHSIHHEQSSMSMLTSSRNHPVDAMLSVLTIFTVFRLIGLPNDVGVVAAFAIGIHSYAVHANVRSSFGLVGRFVISPQWHRVHHSTNPAHFDRNFGGNLTIWDHLFGTALKDTTLYPATGFKPNASDADARLYGPRHFGASLTRPFRNPTATIFATSRVSGSSSTATRGIPPTSIV